MSPTMMATMSRQVGQQGLQVKRHFTKPGIDPLSEIQWERRRAEIKGQDGKVISSMDDVEVPSFWSQAALDIAADKYFRKAGVPGRGHEWSVRQLVTRVAKAIRLSGESQGGYFATPADADTFEAELTYMLVHQFGAFNSPVWFNTGLFEAYGIKGDPSGLCAWDQKTGSVVEMDACYVRPQVSACFIQSIDDDLMDIADFVKREMRLFKFGSGSGANFSRLRALGEGLSGGGTSSGMMSFLKVFDVSAGSIKSGGVTRRAAKMVCVDVDHPDVMSFIEWKAKEEDKALALIRAGYPSDFNGEAYSTVSGQNANNSVRLSDEFMQAVIDGKPWETKWRKSGKIAHTLDARRVFRRIAECAHRCADPGLQFDTTINRWHTVPASGRINASNPCAEYMSLDDTACNLASLNLMKFMRRTTGKSDWSFDVESYVHAATVFTLAQEILVDYAAYPTARIAQNTHDFRQLGLGYANLGALLMVQGVPYDSSKGRGIAGALTAILTGTGYRTSAQIAANKGPFPGFAHNRDAMLKVMRMHQSAVDEIDSECPAYLVSSARDVWADTVSLGERFGYRNSQATVIAPTGCLAQNTLVQTSYGLLRLEDLGDTYGEKWQSVDFTVATDQGPRKATKFYVNGASESVVTVTTRRGYVIRGTPQHRIKVLTETGEWAWRRLGELSSDEVVPLYLGGLVGDPLDVRLPEFSSPYLGRVDLRGKAPTKVTPELAEFLGFFMGNGSLHKKGVRLSVCASDHDVVERLSGLGASVFGIDAHVSSEAGCFSIQFNSTRLVEWFMACGFSKVTNDVVGKGHEPRIPTAILKTNDRAVYCAFLRGLFESDGTVSAGAAEFCSAYISFLSDVQSMLLAVGYPTSSRLSHISEKSGEPGYKLRIANVSFNRAWLDEIGFMGARKRSSVQLESVQSGKCDRVPVPEALLNTLVPVGHEQRKRVWTAWSARGESSLTRDMAQYVLEIAPCEKARAELRRLLGFFYDTVEFIELGDLEETFDLSVPDNVTYVANGFVSHNTIGFMMDCDSTGIEPDFALVKFKKLAGGAGEGGVMKIENRSVGPALESLGYSPETISAVLSHLRTTGMIEGAPGIREEHLAAFDCANRCGQLQDVDGKKVMVYGKRFIAPMGHIKMLEAVQPFVSGSISKTVNCPKETTVDEIEALHMEAWKRKLKCIAIYRDDSKHSQVLSSGSGDKKTEKETKALSPVPSSGETVLSVKRSAVVEDETHSEHGPPQTRRHRLQKPKRAGGETFELKIGSSQKVYVRTGEYADGSLGEVFIDLAKDGSTLRSMMNMFAIGVSLGLQHGVPLQEFVDAFTFQKFEPAGAMDHPHIKRVTSLVDAVFKVLALEYGDESAFEAFAQVQPTPEEIEDIRARRAIKLTLAHARAAKAKSKLAPVNGNGAHANGNGAHANGNGAPKTASFKRVAATEGQTCSRCGGLTVRSGACYTCPSCGQNTGCS